MNLMLGRSFCCDRTYLTRIIRIIYVSIKLIMYLIWYVGCQNLLATGSYFHHSPATSNVFVDPGCVKLLTCFIYPNEYNLFYTLHYCQIKLLEWNLCQLNLSVMRQINQALHVYCCMYFTKGYLKPREGRFGCSYPSSMTCIRRLKRKSSGETRPTKRSRKDLHAINTLSLLIWVSMEKKL